MSKNIRLLLTQVYRRTYRVLVVHIHFSEFKAAKEKGGHGGKFLKALPGNNSVGL